jgi:hypothetical protein
MGVRRDGLHTQHLWREPKPLASFRPLLERVNARLASS